MTLLNIKHHNKYGNNWGTTLMTLTINFDFRKKLQKLNFSFSLCYQCSTCTGACPVAKITNGEFNPRKIIESAILGLEEKLIEKQEPNVWLCSTCQKCVELCPQGVELTNVFELIQNYSTQRKKWPEAFKSQTETIYENGVAIPLGDVILKRRNQLGLPERITAETKEIQKLMQITKVNELIKSSESVEGK